MDLFEIVKRLDLAQYIESSCEGKVRKVGKDLFINPCQLPGCGHRDCFSIDREKQMFYCFSCSRGGTVVDFEMLRAGLSEPLEAARQIASKVGIDLEEIQGQKRDEPVAASFSKSKGSDKEKEEPKPISIEVLSGYQPIPEKVRKFLEKERGWSREIIKEYQVGYNERLKRITIPIFDDQGQIRNVRQYQPGAARNKMISFGRGYGQARLFPFSALQKAKPGGEVVLCEGEPDILCGLSQGFIAVTATAGAGTWRTDWNRHFKGLHVVIAFDNDPPGRSGAQKVGKALSGVAGLVEVIQWPSFMKDGQDLTDWFVEYKKTGEELLALPRKKIDEDSGKKKAENKAISNLVPDSTVYDFDSFQVIGELEDCRIIIESLDIRKIHIIPLKEITMEKCIQFGGEEVHVRVERQMEAVAAAIKDGNPLRKLHFYDFRRKLILQARGKQLGPLKWIGQGVYALRDNRLLIVNGNSTFSWDENSFSEFSGTFVENKIISRNAGRAWIDSEKLIEQVLKMNRERAREIVDELIGLNQQWGFSGAFDVALIAGFLLAQIVQSVWDWRPHLWVSGKHGSGKTLLLTLFEEIGGRLSQRFEGSSTSEAGFRQSIEGDNCLASLDEFERSQSRVKIIEYLRGAGRGGAGAKGGSDQKPVKQEVKHMVLLASIESGLSWAAEKDRFILIETKKDSKRDPYLPSIHEVESLRLRFFAVALWGALNARRRIQNLVRIPGYDPRVVQGYAVPLAMVTLADDNPQESLQRLLENVLADRKESGQGLIQEDEDRLLDDILASTIRTDVSEDAAHTLYGDRSMAWLLLQSSSPVHKKDLEAVGIKKVGKGIFLAGDLIRRKLLRDTVWRDMNITSILKRMPGATHVRRRLSGRLFWGVLFSNMEDVMGAREDQKDMLFTESPNIDGTIEQ